MKHNIFTKVLFIAIAIVASNMTTAQDKAYYFHDVKPYTQNSITIEPEALTIYNDTLVCISFTLSSTEALSGFYAPFGFLTQFVLASKTSDGKQNNGSGEKMDTLLFYNIVLLDPMSGGKVVEPLFGYPYWDSIPANCECKFFVAYRLPEENRLMGWANLCDSMIKRGEVRATITSDYWGWGSFGFYDCPLKTQAPNYYYLASTTSEVNMRADSTTSSEKLTTLAKESFLYVDVRNSSSAFYKATDIETGMEGYVSKAYVDLLSPTGKIGTGDLKEIKGNIENIPPTVVIHNHTIFQLTVRMGGETVTIKPHSKEIVTAKAGECYYTASCFGCRPYVGRSILKAGYEYEWGFYIQTTFGLDD